MNIKCLQRDQSFPMRKRSVLYPPFLLNLFSALYTEALNKFHHCFFCMYLSASANLFVQIVAVASTTTDGDQNAFQPHVNQTYLPRPQQQIQTMKRSQCQAIGNQSKTSILQYAIKNITLVKKKDKKKKLFSSKYVILFFFCFFFQKTGPRQKCVACKIVAHKECMGILEKVR